MDRSVVLSNNQVSGIFSNIWISRKISILAVASELLISNYAKYVRVGSGSGNYSSKSREVADPVIITSNGPSAIIRSVEDDVKEIFEMLEKKGTQIMCLSCHNKLLGKEDYICG